MMNVPEGISPTMQAKMASTGNDSRQKHNLMFDSMFVGTTVKIPIESIKETVLRSLASRAGKRLGRKFMVVKHQTVGIYEIGRKL